MGSSVPTLRQVLIEYIRLRKLKEATAEDYKKRLHALDDWLDLPITAITKNDVEDRHSLMSLKAPAQANLVFRVLRAMLNFAKDRYEIEGEPLLKGNPVRRLSEARSWNKLKRRTSYIQPHQMAIWWRALLSLDNGTTRDYLLTLLLLGARAGEGANLKWTNVDIEGRCVTFENTKNGDDHKLPIPNFLYSVLSSRYCLRTSEWVFPGRVHGQPIINCNSSYETLIRRSGIAFMPHDLRRTFATYADLAGLDEKVIAVLLNHKSSITVTGGYIVRSVERLREPLQQVEDCILGWAEVPFPLMQSRR